MGEPPAPDGLMELLPCCASVLFSSFGVGPWSTPSGLGEQEQRPAGCGSPSGSDLPRVPTAQSATSIPRNSRAGGVGRGKRQSFPGYPFLLPLPRNRSSPPKRAEVGALGPRPAREPPHATSAPGVPLAVHPASAAAPRAPQRLLGAGHGLCGTRSARSPTPPRTPPLPRASRASPKPRVGVRALRPQAGVFAPSPGAHGRRGAAGRARAAATQAGPRGRRSGGEGRRGPRAPARGRWQRRASAGGEAEIGRAHV